MGDAGRHMGLIGGRMHGRAFGAFAGGKRNLFAKQATAPPSDWDEDFLAFWERTTGTPDSWKEAYNELFFDLKSAGYFQKADAIYWRGAHNEYDARLNLVKNAHNSTAINSPYFSARLGFRGTGQLGQSWLNDQFNPAADGVQYTINDSCVLSYIYYTYPSGNHCLFGCTDGGHQTALAPLGTTCYATINDYTNLTFSCVDEIGIYAVGRIGNDKYAKINSDVHYATSAPNGLPNNNMASLAINNGGSSALWSIFGESFKYIGAYLTPSDADVIKVIVENMLTKVAAL